MAKKFLVNLDMNKNQLLNALMQILATNPSGEGLVEALLWYNSTDKKPKFYDGTSVKTLATTDDVGGAQNVFSKMSDGTNVAEADSTTDTFVFSAGSGITVTVNAAADTLTITNSDRGSSAVSTHTSANDHTKLHTQHTDTGTTSATFKLNSGSSGAMIKDVSGVLQVRNAGDTDFADLTAKNVTIEGNVTVKGTTTTVETETVEVHDNIMRLNSDATGTPTEDGGIEVERGDSTNAQILWDESSDDWKAGVVGALKSLARRYAADVGDGSNTSLTVTHSLGTRDVTVAVYENSSPYAEVLCDVEHTSTTTVTLKFATAPTSDQYRCVVTG